MDEIITEKTYPIQGIWILKILPGYLGGLIFTVLMLFISRLDNSETSVYSFLIIYSIIITFHIIQTILRRLTFHYSIEGHFLTLKQGIFSKQERHIPYGVIQNLLIKQDLLDRIIGIASLTIENASQGASTSEQRAFGMKINSKQQQIEMVGFIGNKVSIPGLTKQNAETLKEIVLKKMKENPLEDSQSGL